MPSQNMDDSHAFTRSKQILLDHQTLKRMNPRDLKDLIQHVLHHPAFNSAEVDHNIMMHERLMRAIEDGQLTRNILDMWQEQDGREVRSKMCNLSNAPL